MLLNRLGLNQPAGSGKRYAFQEYLARVSFMDSSLDGHISPLDDSTLGTPNVEDPAAAFEVLNTASETIRKKIDTVDNPFAFFGILMEEADKLLQNPDLPTEVAETLNWLVERTRQDIQTIYQEKAPADREDGEAGALAVMRDVKEISRVPLTGETIEKIHVSSVPLSEIKGLEEVLPVIKDLPKHCGLKGGAARLAFKMYILQKLEEDQHTPEPPVPRSSREIGFDEFWRQKDARRNWKWRKFKYSPEAVATLKRLIAAELPLSDVDIVVSKEAEDPRAIAEKMEVPAIDAEGITNWKKAALIDYLGRRDLSDNQALIANGQLFFEESAASHLAENPGEARSIVAPIPGLFGRETFFVNKRRYLAANTLYRLVKTVSEGKHEHFNIPKYNLDSVPLGKYWLTMVRKWISRPHRAEIFARAHSCALQMGTTKAKTPAEFLTELLEIDSHEEEPFKFNELQTTLDGTKWMLKKYVLFVEKILRRRHKLRPDSAVDNFSSTDNTVIEVRPNTDDLHPNDIDAVEAIFKELETRP